MRSSRKIEHAPVCGPYGGEIAEPYDDPEFRAWLAEISTHLLNAGAPTPGQRGAALHELGAPWRGQTLSLVIKSQGPLSALKSWPARLAGTAAERGWRVARHLAARGVGTPEPVAWLERWDSGACRESHLITRQIDPATNFRDELGRLLWHDPDAGRVIALLNDVAQAVRTLHDAGVLHNDLGNQNILLQLSPTARATGVYFVDLSRADLIGSEPSPKQRAKDLSRIHLPSDLLRIFSEIYWNGRAPDEFVAALRWARRRYRLRFESRRLRHPVQYFRWLRAPAEQPVYPPPRDIWIWDEKSSQPVNAWASRDRNRFYPRGNLTLIGRETARAFPTAWKSYAELRKEAFAQPVAMNARWGISVEPQPDTWEREQALLPARPGQPVLIRLYRHKGAGQWEFAIHAGRELASRGFAVGFALCQDRRALLEPASWAAMCEQTIPQVAPFAEWIEAGHAINRAKWGMWRLAEYRNLAEPLIDLKSQFPSLRLMGPAVIDFEYYTVVAALASLPRDFRFDALSLHLYVDRRGAPENRQSGFASVDKFALARALARTSRHCDDRLIVSEVNWPLAGTGIHSPVGSPYIRPGLTVGAPNVSERDYARFMVRYLLQAACSGFVDRVYWWRLAAHGFGLVDNLTEPWRPRPAYRAWLRLLEILGDATFERNLPAGEGAFLHLFRRTDGEQVAVGYAWQPQMDMEWPFSYRHAEDCEGGPLAEHQRALGADPVYFRGVTSVP